MRNFTVWDWTLEIIYLRTERSLFFSSQREYFKDKEKNQWRAPDCLHYTAYQISNLKLFTKTNFSEFLIKSSLCILDPLPHYSQTNNTRINQTHSKNYQMFCYYWLCTLINKLAVMKLIKIPILTPVSCPTKACAFQFSSTPLKGTLNLPLVYLRAKELS